MITPHLILASQSPRRRELLSLLGLPFTTLSVGADETFDPINSIEENVQEIAIHKAKAAKAAYRGTVPAVIIGADTIVDHGHSVLGKPSGYEDAFRMLHNLQNNTHKVHTGFSVISDSHQHCECVTTEVTFEPIDDREIRRYIEQIKPFDKAGSYGIQDPIMACYVRRIKGCYYNVVGLPVSRLYLALKSFIPGL
ncbi:MAG: Maf family protein [Chlorobium sp.]|jgi:septum formation protein|uniref:Maf family protein n=1 Tax=Chlorobium sp. TaxID=1095 RepID=UPI001DB5988A|nr:Maf family protein [Chlorobium sp.]MBN1278379.1 septum formation protein Maf [Chlorobiaceae bacterium]MCF8216056.1 Maf family protein [Chlorobium sp.]MCF8270957.1 Maf family protein [Chlorobium sp.]MCF8287331.1 Maf family protein [Chlorobium sp.]MCF8291417.1 Maf family protein [Chlorobium sp.]